MPTLLLLPGDGIGPEIIAKYVATTRPDDLFVIGDINRMRSALTAIGSSTNRFDYRFYSDLFHGFFCNIYDVFYW